MLIMPMIFLNEAYEEGILNQFGQTIAAIV